VADNFIYHKTPQEAQRGDSVHLTSLCCMVQQKFWYVEPFWRWSATPPPFTGHMTQPNSGPKITLKKLPTW